MLFRSEEVAVVGAFLPQAYEAGRRLRKMLRADDTLHFFTSPYRRTRETTEGILATLTSDEPEPSPFKRNNIKVYEEPRLREQDFGNFQPCSAEMERMWQERADYGHFFYRIPNGSSTLDTTCSSPPPRGLKVGGHSVEGGQYLKLVPTLAIAPL